MSRIPLTDRYPGVASLPRVGLVEAPTPVDNLGPLEPDANHAVGGVWAKRDDLTSTLYGGNKTRKLEFLLGDALKKGQRAVITFGAYGSNHALATAVHASALGLEPHVVLSPQPPGPFAARTLRAHAGLGTKLHLIDGWDGRRAAVEAKRELAARDGIEPAIIPMGGTSALGALGYVNAAFEVLEQAKTLDPGSLSIQRGDFVLPDVVYVAAGTLGTAIGLAVGFAAAGARTKVVAVRVTPEEVGSDPIARKLAAETIALLRSLDAGFPSLAYGDLNFELRHDWFEPGYGVVTPETTDAVTRAAAHNIKLETTYTGKAFAAMLADASSGRVDRADHVLFWDTYNSGHMPPEGDDDGLPPVLQEYVAECDRLFGRS
jgi:1-aminocyclopropane-1-carboxylate deaminase/D-cysteine desulfhydrase-like pyridoxal-dependent ACC family enzyme